MREVAMVAAGMTQFGELWKHSLRDLFVEAAAEALKQAGVDHLDDIYVGNMSGGQFVGQEHVAPLMVDHLGMAGVCATRGGVGVRFGRRRLRLGYMAVGSGMSDMVLVAGVEKMTDGADVTSVLASAADQETEVYHGITFPGLYAMIARAHMEAHGTTEEDMAWVSVKNHAHGAKNPKAQFPRVITVDDVMNSSMVADPMRLLNCSPVSDGAAAVLLCPLDQAHKYTDNPVRITGSGQATGFHGSGRPQGSGGSGRGGAFPANGAFKMAETSPARTSTWRRSTTASPSRRSAAWRRSHWSAPAMAPARRGRASPPLEGASP